MYFESLLFHFMIDNYYSLELSLYHFIHYNNNNDDNKKIIYIC